MYCAFSYLKGETLLLLNRVGFWMKAVHEKTPQTLPIRVLGCDKGADDNPTINERGRLRQCSSCGRRSLYDATTTSLRRVISRSALPMYCLFMPLW